MDKIIQFLAKNPTFYFATVEGDKPRVRPFGFFMKYNDKIYFGMGKHKASYRQVVANPNVEICTASAQGQWIRIKGTAVFDESEETMAKAFEVLPRLKQTYNAESGLTLANFYLKDGEAEIADMQGNFEKIRF
ncbi:MAG: pyridoxamine 5'-phosphate oxidase family protein [Desulfotomaculaceae bacterium]|nr:pyridoxamine 5'-phosphate oxidase family protein [Desulfotomaculaceae bacterium]